MRVSFWVVFCALIATAAGQSLIAVVSGYPNAYFSQTTGTSYTYYCSNVTGLNPAQQTCISLGLGSPVAQGRWGRPASGTQVSGLGFDPSLNITINLYSFQGTTSSSDFFLGTLNHFNWPITNAATGTSLSIVFSLSDQRGTTLGTNTFTYQFQVDETPNVAPCAYPSVTPCADKISFINGGFDFARSFQIGQANYTLQLLGFKETQYSGSTPLTYFISQENGISVGYLFGRLTLACPTSCRGGGNLYIDANGNCKCNCATATPCPIPGQEYAPDCSCRCPASKVCLNGGTVTSNCTCNCPACPFPKVANADCSCSCPTNYCGTCGVVNPTNCSCSCSNCAPCALQNFVYDSTCGCTCPITTASCKSTNPNTIEDPDPNVCKCICDPAVVASCTGNFRMDTNCNCYCPAGLCPNGITITSNCTCGPCTPSGNWVKDPVTGRCDKCGLTQQNCNGSSILDLTTCSCICSNLTCNINQSLVVDSTQFCACRPCRAGECLCGNGIVEPGEDCDRFNDPCCVKCKYTTNPCDDGNGCTNDFCNGNGTCIGTYKCASSTECLTIQCDPKVGVCNATNEPDGKQCGADAFGKFDLCNKRCTSGLCATSPVVCVDPNTNDCSFPVCVPETGTCTGTRFENTTHICSDGNLCTFSDHCDGNGLCVGSPVQCAASPNVCVFTECDATTGSCVEKPKGGTVYCDADHDNCTQFDICKKGVCTPGDRVVCPASQVCSSFVCNSTTGGCDTIYTNDTCNDKNVCTEEDACVLGNCVGKQTERTKRLPECGAVVIPPGTPATSPTVPITIITVTGAAALVGAIVGAAFLIKKIRDSRLLDPDTWNPDTFSSIGANPLYKGSVHSVDNRLYEAPKV